MAIQYKYQEAVLPDGSAIILNENGTIEAYDASGNLIGTYSPGDAEWQARATQFDLTPKTD